MLRNQSVCEQFRIKCVNFLILVDFNNRQTNSIIVVNLCIKNKIEIQKRNGELTQIIPYECHLPNIAQNEKFNKSSTFDR